jgi:Zn-dependent M28 family amino/carboxypeptidase
MQFATCCSVAGSSEATKATLEDNGLRWLQFGNDYFCFTLDPAASIDWGKLRKRGENATIGKPGRLDAGHLYLISQEGRLFQRAYPNVPVLLDKGRLLVVSLDARQARGIVQHKARFSLRPLTGSEAIFETLARPSTQAPAEKRIKDLVGEISRADFAAALTELASFPTRHSLTQHFKDAATRMKDRLTQMGYDVAFQPFPIAGGETLNVIADKRGLAAAGRSLTLVTAHLDSVNHPSDHSLPDDPAAPAPGADDNGSGSAGVMEIARVLQKEPTRNDLRLILFGGEEQGLFGSIHYVKQLPPADRVRIKSVVNMDMIAVVNTNSPTVLLEGKDPLSKTMMAGLSAAAHTYTKLTVNTSLDPHNSDHVPFIDAGIPSVLTIEGNDDANENIHNANDTLDHVSYELALEILQMNTAFTATEIGV